MRPIKYATLIVVSLAGMTGISAEAAADPNQQIIVEGNNKFALELYQALQSQQGNLFLSPYSISTALAMTYAGARGQTQEQMAKTLNFPTTTLSNEQFHSAFGAIIRKLNAAGQIGGCELAVANALWGQKDYKFLQEFLTLVRTNYDGDLRQVDFAKQTEAARKTINDWVEGKTREKIKELIKPGMLDSMTRLVLTNAIYFKGKWASQFKPDKTQDAPFILLGGQKVNVPMMNQTGQFGYAQTDAIQLLEMPYINNELSMVVLLPNKLDGVNELEKGLTADNLAGWLAKLRKREVQVWLPRFKLTCEFSLAETLGSMGMPDAFSSKADFSGMTGNRELFISAVVHKAYVEVNEEGTEAAAATGVAMKLTSVPLPPPVFKADHPFVFLIRDNHTGSILFIGRATTANIGS
jgi:serpin B